jgi:hypothetical protein
MSRCQKMLRLCLVVCNGLLTGDGHEKRHVSGWLASRGPHKLAGRNSSSRRDDSTTETSRPASAITRRHQHSRTRKVAPRSSWLSNSSLMKRSRGSAGVALGSVAIASSLVTMRAQRAFTSLYVDISCCKDGWFI